MGGEGVCGRVCVGEGVCGEGVCGEGVCGEGVWGECVGRVCWGGCAWGRVCVCVSVHVYLQAYFCVQACVHVGMHSCA